jgi:hypothetical protein
MDQTGGAFGIWPARGLTEPDPLPAATLHIMFAADVLLTHVSAGLV